MPQTNIHPEYFQTKVTCITCSNNFMTGSTRGKEIRVDTCSNCHPFYTGKQSFASATGRVERFKTKASQQVEIKPKVSKVIENKTKLKNSKIIVLDYAKDVLKLTDKVKK